MAENDEPQGRAVGGKARMGQLSADERKAQAQKAAAARWSGEVKQATHGSDDHPLTIGEIRIPCFVLDDDTRVLSQRGLQSGIGMSTSGGSVGAHRLAQFVEGLAEKGVDCKDLAMRIRKPIHFRSNKGGKVAYGYEATMLADVCDAVLAARKVGALAPNQMRIADQCEILVRGFARVGIIALVDEATGYQKDRAADSLAKILEAFIAKELQPWVPTFPVDFYEEMFRLRGLDFPTESVRRPRYFGLLTNNIVYERLAPGVLSELRRVTPRNESGRPTAKYFQSLTANKGYHKLKEHLGAVVALMKISDTWDGFMRLLDKHYTRYGDTVPLPLDDDGKGL